MYLYLCYYYSSIMVADLMNCKRCKLQHGRQPRARTNPNTLSINIWTLQDPPHSLCKLLSATKSPRVHRARHGRAFRTLRHVRYHGGVEYARGNSHNTNSMAGEVACEREGHGAKGAFAGGVGGLALLAFESSCTRDENHDAALAVLAVFRRDVNEVLEG